jgi:CheY-like chemotaxis protein
MKSIHALLVDDDKSSLETMGLILEMDEYLVSRADSGRTALERLERSEEFPPGVDFLVVDLDMNNLSGIELLTEMRRRGHTVPVMVVTGFASKGTVVELLRHGVSDFLDKPIQMEEFRLRVHQIANEALKRRRRAENASPALPVPGETPSPVAAPFRSVAVLDLGNLGVPYALRRMLDTPARNNMVMACKRRNGFDILLADVGGSDAESFYASVLIKTFYDRCRARETEGAQFITELNQVILEGALKKQDIGAMFIRVRHAERRIEIHPAGFPCQFLIGLGGKAPQAMAFTGAPLGTAQQPGMTVCELPYQRGDRIFFISETEADRRPDQSALDLEALIREPSLSHGYGSLDQMADGIWRNIRMGSGHGKDNDALLLGLELI